MLLIYCIYMYSMFHCRCNFWEWWTAWNFEVLWISRLAGGIRFFFNLQKWLLRYSFIKKYHFLIIYVISLYYDGIETIIVDFSKLKKKSAFPSVMGGTFLYKSYNWRVFDAMYRSWWHEFMLDDIIRLLSRYLFTDFSLFNR